jgi:hypothetical protein
MSSAEILQKLLLCIKLRTILILQHVVTFEEVVHVKSFIYDQEVINFSPSTRNLYSQAQYTVFVLSLWVNLDDVQFPIQSLYPAISERHLNHSY